MKKTIRIVFEADCYAEGETYQEAYNNFLDMDLFDDGKAGWVNLICIEDAETYDDITKEINK